MAVEAGSCVDRFHTASACPGIPYEFIGDTFGLLEPDSTFADPWLFGFIPTSAVASLFPTNAAVADMAHRQKALVGYVHPYDAFPDPAKDATLTHELPVDVALGKVDYIEVLGFSDHKSTAAVWYRLLNCGFRFAPQRRVRTPWLTSLLCADPSVSIECMQEFRQGPIDIESWLNSLKQGRTFATNGPLLGFTLGDRTLGDELHLAASEHKIKFSAWLRSIVPVDHLEIICNGRMMRESKLTGDHELG